MFGKDKKSTFQKIQCPIAPNNSKNWLAVKYPGNEFITGSILEVPPGTVAIAVHGGMIEHVFTNGSVTLTTENFPFLEKHTKKLFGGYPPFNMEFYYLNATAQHKFMFGSTKPLTLDTGFVEDHGKSFRLHYNGEYFLRVKHYQFLYQWILGSLNYGEFVYWENVASQIENTVNEKVKSFVNRFYTDNKLNMNTVEGASENCSEAIMTKMKPFCEEQFGLELQNVNINLIVNPEDREKHNKERDELQSMELRGSSSQAGFDRTIALQQMEAMKIAAGNQGTVGAGVGIGMGFGLGGAIYNASQQMGQQTMNNQNNANQQQQNPQPQQQTGSTCRFCGGPVTTGAKFCPNCGKDISTPPAPKFCPNCGSPLAEGAKFCPNCGNKVE